MPALPRHTTSLPHPFLPGAGGREHAMLAHPPHRGRLLEPVPAASGWARVGKAGRWCARQCMQPSMLTVRKSDISKETASSSPC